jgi:xanthine dehydrogenase YagS FAD-binding subunit
MTPFKFQRATDVPAAIRMGREPGARYLGGGTNLIDLMRETIETPAALIDVSRLSQRIEEGADGSIMIGAGVKNSVLASHAAVRARYPVLAEAIVSGASGQIRNMASAGGNLLQRTRCNYFYDGAARCNKRAAGTGCDAADGINRGHAIFGASAHCVATHPSDMCVALAALDAIVHIDGPDGARAVPMVDFHRLPGETPAQETVLRTGELITAIELPAAPDHSRSAYRKVRDRASYAFALVSVAATLVMDGATIRHAAIALGGVAHKPWRATAAEAVLAGRRADAAAFTDAAAAAMAGAVPLAHNGFKVELARRVIVAVLEKLASQPAAFAAEDRA